MPARRLFSLATAFVLFALPLAAGACECPAGTALLAQLPAEGAPGVVACGKLEGAPRPEVWRARELELRSCLQANSLFQCEPLTTCELRREGAELVATQLRELPFGPAWEWLDVALSERRARLGARGTAEVAERVVLTAPEVATAQKATVLATVARWKELDEEAQETLIYQVLAVALTGDATARVQLQDLKRLAWEADLLDPYDEATEIFQIYARGTGKVPALVLEGGG